MEKTANSIALDNSNIHVYFHSHCEAGEVDDELIERLEVAVNLMINDNKQYLFSYINASHASPHFKLFENLTDMQVKEIVVLYRSYVMEDATEVVNILLNDYKDDLNNRNIRNHPKRIVKGGNDEYFVFIAVS